MMEHSHFFWSILQKSKIHMMLQMKLKTIPALIMSCFFILPCSANSEKDNIFDSSQVDASLEYLKQPSKVNLAKVADSSGMRHLKKHSDLTGYYSQQSTAEFIAKDLLTRKTYTKKQISTVEKFILLAKNNTQKQRYCVTKTKEYLPENFNFKGHLYFTWGYDIGVTSGVDSSLNLVHRHFLENPDELWLYCVHEMHHAGVLHFNKMPDYVNVKTGDELFQLLKFATFLEGTAVYAAYEARKIANALDERDYLALRNDELMKNNETEYFSIFDKVRKIGSRQLTEDDWKLLDPMSDGKRLWYRVGAKIAEKIDTTLGREQLTSLIEKGPDVYFATYFSLL